MARIPAVGEIWTYGLDRYLCVAEADTLQQRVAFALLGETDDRAVGPSIWRCLETVIDAWKPPAPKMSGGTGGCPALPKVEVRMVLGKTEGAKVYNLPPGSVVHRTPVGTVQHHNPDGSITIEVGPPPKPTYSTRRRPAIAYDPAIHPGNLIDQKLIEPEPFTDADIGCAVAWASDGEEHTGVLLEVRPDRGHGSMLLMRAEGGVHWQKWAKDVRRAPEGISQAEVHDAYAKKLEEHYGDRPGWMREGPKLTRENFDEAAKRAGFVPCPGCKQYQGNCTGLYLACSDDAARWANQDRKLTAAHFDLARKVAAQEAAYIYPDDCTAPDALNPLLRRGAS